MNEPHWHTKHSWWEEDFRFWSEERIFYVNMLQRHPEDKIGQSVREIIGMIDLRVKRLKKEYKKIYGANFNMRRVENA